MARARRRRYDTLERAMQKLRNGLVAALQADAAGLVTVSAGWFAAHAPGVPAWWEGTPAEWRTQWGKTCMEVVEEDFTTET